MILSVVGRVITKKIIKKSNVDTETKNEAKRLRSPTIAFAKLEERDRIRNKREKSNTALKTISYLGCTNITFADCIIYVYIPFGGSLDLSAKNVLNILKIEVKISRESKSQRPIISRRPTIQN